MLRRLLPIVALTILPSALPAQASVAGIVRRASSAIVVLRRFDASGRETGLGNGFVMQDGRIATNHRVVAGAQYVEVESSGGDLLGSYPFAEVVSQSADLAILPRLPSAPAGLRLSARAAEVGDRILVMGTPPGLSTTVSDGLVSSFRAIGGQRLMQISAPVSSGSSGGPVLNSAGEVVGVSVSRIEGQNLHLAVPASILRVLAASPAGRVDLASSTRETGTPGAGRPPRDVLPLDWPIRRWLEVTDPLLPGNSHADEYAHYGRKGDTLVVTMYSSAFDAVLSLHALAGDQYPEVARNDNGAGGTDSRLALTLPNEGRYVVRASSVEPGALGAYTISMHAPNAQTVSVPRGDAPAPVRRPAVMHAHFAYTVLGCRDAARETICTLRMENRGNATANRHIYIDDAFLLDAAGGRTQPSSTAAADTSCRARSSCGIASSPREPTWTWICTSPARPVHPGAWSSIPGSASRAERTPS